jgi:hypothetical protein
VFMIYYRPATNPQFAGCRMVGFGKIERWLKYHDDLFDAELDARSFMEGRRCRNDKELSMVEAVDVLPQEALPVRIGIRRALKETLDLYFDVDVDRLSTRNQWNRSRTYKHTKRARGLYHGNRTNKYKGDN